MNDPHDPRALAGAPLEASHVWLAYRGMLGREPSDAECEHQLATLQTVEQLVAVIEGSAELAARRGIDPAKLPPQFRTTANCWHPDLAEITHRVGTTSSDEVATVGQEGWVFLTGGSNSVVEQFRGTVRGDDAWFAGWRALRDERKASAERIGVAAAAVIVPDKLAVYAEQFPERFPADVVRPALRLADELGVGYPVEALRAARDRATVCLRTDSHLTSWGNYVVFRSVMEQWGLEAPPYERFTIASGSVMSGDLGARLLPPAVERAYTAGSLGAAELAQDNYGQVQAAGGHIGIRRVYRNPDADHRQTVVLFGDSYGIGSPWHQGLSWFLAQSFTEVHFLWAPFGWDSGYLRRTAAALVVSETAERFVIRTPAAETDIEALIARAESGSEAINPSVLFAEPASANHFPAPGGREANEDRTA